MLHKRGSGTEACRDVQERRFTAAPVLTNDVGLRSGGRVAHIFRVLPPVAVLALSTLTVFLSLDVLAQKTSPANANASLPPGAMQARAITACTECHEARIIVQQRLSKAAWTKEVDKMTKWGAVVDPADRDALIEYLSANFSPDEPAYEPQRTTAERTMRRISK